MCCGDSRSYRPRSTALETGVTGIDFDIGAMLGESDTAWEVKCKLEGTAINESTVKNSINKARSQLPTDRPTVVVLKIPEIWVTEPSIEAQFRTVISDVFRSTGRISAIVVRWERWTAIGKGAVCALLTRTYHNNRARHPLLQFGDLIAHPINFDGWVTVPEILQSAG